AGNLVYTTDGSNLIIYNAGQTGSTSAVATVTVPTDHGVSIVPNSFSLAPTKITTGATATVLEWDLTFDAGHKAQTITWQSRVDGLQPGEGRTVATLAGITFTAQGTPGTIALPDQVVAGTHVIGLTPPARTTTPGTAVTFTVNLVNPTPNPVTYFLSVQGLAA